jgi:acyl-CoA thioesterase I
VWRYAGPPVVSVRLALCSLVLLVTAGCAGGGSSPTPGTVPDGTPAATGSATMAPLRFVALGDSYTIGTGVRMRERWPNQLVRALRPDIELTISANLARNGATSQDIIVEQLPQLQALRPHVVSLLVGVNDAVVGVDPETYRSNVSTILQAITARVPPERVFVVTTPDYTLTPRGGDYGDRAQQRAGIQAYNEILGEEAEARGMNVVDITHVSDRVPDDPSLLAADALHPSAKQYAGWVEVIARSMRERLGTAG